MGVGRKTARKRAVGTREHIISYVTEVGELFDANGMASTRLAAAVGYPGSSVAFAQLLSGMERSGLIERDGTGAVEHHGVLRRIEDRRFDAVLRWTGIDDGVDFAVEIVEDVGRRCGADMAEDVGAGRRDRHSRGTNKFERNRMRGHPDSCERTARGDDVWDSRSARQQERQRPRPEGAYELLGSIRDIRGNFEEHRILIGRSRDVDDDGIPRGAMLGLEDAGDSFGIECVGSEAVYRLGGQGNQASAAKNLRCLSDGGLRRVGMNAGRVDGEAKSLHCSILTV